MSAKLSKKHDPFQQSTGRYTEADGEAGIGEGLDKPSRHTRDRPKYSRREAIDHPCDVDDKNVQDLDVILKDIER